MTIGTRRIDHFAENTVLCHVERVELKEVVAAVFKHHAVQTLAFGEVDECPNLGHTHGRRYFDSHVLALF